MGAGFTRGSRKHVDGGNQLHVREAGPLDGVQVLSLQESAADSSGPQVHVGLGAFGHLFVDHDVGQ
jgi:hypothetical protein